MKPLRTTLSCVIVLFGLGSSLAAQTPASSTQGQESATPGSAGAPDSNFVDLAKRGKGKLKAAIQDYLDETNLTVGENPNGLWVETGTASVTGQPGSPTWGESRRFAFMQARLDAEARLVKSLSLQAQVATLLRVVRDDSVMPPSFAQPEGFEDRMKGKIEQLTEAQLDKALADLGEQAPPSAKLVEKRELYNRSLTKQSLQRACEKVSGFYILTTMEATDESSGRVSVGVIIGRRANTMGWISEVARGGGASGVPLQAPGRPMAERIAKDAAGLYDKFGVRVVADERGVVHLISYGQSAPDIRKGMDEEEIDQKIEGAESFAENDAINGMVEFLNSTLAWQRNVEEGQSVRQLETISQQQGADLTQKETVTDLIKKLRETTARFSTADLKGLKTYRQWQGNHPNFGNSLVGCVVIWSPESAASAQNYNRTAPAGTGPGFKPTGPKPGVRRSGNEDPPKEEKPLVEGGPNKAVPAAPVAVAPVDECDGTVAVGTGLSRETAVIEALEAAVRQKCGVSVASTTEISERVASTVADRRVNEACEEMRTSFASASLLSKDISVRTRGLINEYRVISEEPVGNGGRVRVSICAKVATFDPRNPRPGAKPTVIIATPTARVDAFEVNGSRVPASEVTRYIESGVSRELLRTKAFSLLERENLAALLGEQAFILTGVADIKEQVKLGKMLAADYLLFTEIEDLHAGEDEKVIKLTGNRIVKRYGAIKVAWKLVSVATREQIDSDVVSIAADEDGFKELGRRYPGSPIASALVSSALDRMVPDLSLRAAPVRIAQVVGKEVFINRGSSVVKAGTEYDIYRTSSELRDPASGRSLGNAETKVGRIRVERCETEFCVAQILSGEVGSEDAGSFCRTTR